jgi:hypothetical protein
VQIEMQHAWQYLVWFHRLQKYHQEKLIFFVMIAKKTDLKVSQSKEPRFLRNETEDLKKIGKFQRAKVLPETPFKKTL